VAVREATVEDARAIAEVHVEGWRWGYRGLLPDGTLDALSVDERERQWVASFTQGWREGDACFLAEDDRGRALGFCACGPAADEPVAPPHGAGEVYSVYLRAAAKDRGVGWRLMDVAESAMRAHGFDRAVLWVLEANARARSFYERRGWGWDGTRAEHRFDLADLPILRYARDL
jgi:ribosomal protein S18 acetylase RimI-like enzyme